MIGKYLDKIAEHKNFLIIGAGGGGDSTIAASYAFTLKKMNKNVFIAGMHKSSIDDLINIDIFSKNIVFIYKNTVITAKERLTEYAIKYYLDDPVFFFSLSHGLNALKNEVRELIKSYKIDFILIADAGVDTLIFGDEPHLGSPGRDNSSLAIASMMNIDSMLVITSLGIEPEMSHYYTFRNISVINKDKGFLGVSVIESIQQKFLKKLITRLLKNTPSPANFFLLNAMEHYFGMLKPPYSWYKDKVFVSPLMYFEFFFDLKTVVKYNRIVPLIKKSRSYKEIENKINIFEKHRRKLKKRIIKL